MSRNQIRFYIVLGAALVAYCVIALAIPFAKNGVYWLSLVFALLAFAVQLYTLPRAMQGDMKSKFYGFPVLRVSLLYLAAQLGLSLVFMTLAQWVPLWLVVMLYVLLLCAALVGFIAAETAKEEVQRQETVQKKNTSVMIALRSRAAVLVSRAADEEARRALEKLSESFRFSDPVSSEATAESEAQLSAMLTGLESALAAGDSAAVPTLCRELEGALALRNQICKESK